MGNISSVSILLHYFIIFLKPGSNYSNIIAIIPNVFNIFMSKCPIMRSHIFFLIQGKEGAFGSTNK